MIFIDLQHVLIRYGHITIVLDFSRFITVCACAFLLLNKICIIMMYKTNYAGVI